MPDVIAILLTYQRTAYAQRTVAAAARSLRCDDLAWYVADDGSDEAHLAAVHETLAQYDQQVVGGHSARVGYGANANRAWREASHYSPITLWLEDDWELTQSLDIRPYVQLLLAHEDVGMVRLGYLNAHMRGTSVARNGRLYWHLDHTPAVDGTPVFTGHPSLRHARYAESYGLYPEGLLPGDTELVYAYEYRVRKGPVILWPATYPEYGLFAHIGAEKSY